MGFYGFITDTSRTSFQFDKIYSTRKQMDENAAKDGIFIGRFVLVDYDYHEDTTYDIDKDKLYADNFNEDQEEYGFSNSRGYDSTVWQKVYVKNEEKYIMVAELNATVPNLELIMDPPSTTPTAPTIDKDSTNVNYKVHLPSVWNLRVKGADDFEVSVKNQDGSIKDPVVKTAGTSSPYTGLSDEKADYGEGEKPAAIYYNKDGFDKSKQNKVNDTENYIKIENTGYSGVYYKVKDSETGEEKEEKIEDTKELSIHLPAIGNMMSEAWDLLYGENRDEDNKNTDNVIGCINKADDVIKELMIN